MTIDEYAALESASGEAVTKVDGVWWKRVRPFFYRPLFPFQEIIPGSKKPPSAALFGGYQHLVPSADLANSHRDLFVWDRHGYSLETVSGQRRNAIKRGMKFFSMKEVTNSEELSSSGYPVYRSFYERTKYSYKKERIHRDRFAEWARTLFRFPKVKILGAYHDGELCGVDISFLVEEVLIRATVFSKTEYLKKQLSDFMAHAVKEKAAACDRIAFVFEGGVSGERGLDKSKLDRGCKIVSKHAFYRLNPLADVIIRSCMKKNYHKIRGIRGIDAAGTMLLSGQVHDGPDNIAGQDGPPGTGNAERHDKENH